MKSYNSINETGGHNVKWNKPSIERHVATCTVSALLGTYVPTHIPTLISLCLSIMILYK